MPWVHIDDLARAYLHAVQHTDMKGPYNIAAPEDVRNREMMREVAMRYITRTSFLPCRALYCAPCWANSVRWSWKGRGYRTPSWSRADLNSGIRS
ncbi:MAG: hypothetical protein IPF78_08695 [Flavobacteriales bacterium]|nr:hypothetical protein [Flavobacteriales bacterium]